MAQLQSASSIVDFLKSRGFAPAAGERVPLFEQRKKIFEQLGLQNQLGQFRGTATQNPALLQSLARLERDTGVKVSPTNIGDILKVGQQPKPVQQPVQQQPMFETGFVDTQTMQPIPQQQIQQQEQQLVPSQRQEQQPQQVQPTTQQQEPPTQMPSQLRETALSLIKQPSPEELSQQALQKFMGSSEFGFAQERAGMEKEKVQQQAKKQTESLISNLASRGLIFSGKKTTGLAGIEADKLANLLNVDREFAYLISRGLESSAKEIAKEAQAGSKQALEALNVLGYGINPLTGGIEPTLQARQLQRQEEQQQLQQERFEQQEMRKTEEFDVRQQQFEQTQQRLEQQSQLQREIQDAKFEYSQAKDDKQFKLAQQKLDLAIKKASKVGVGTGSLGVLTGTAKQKAAAIMNPNSGLSLTDIPIKERVQVGAELNKLKDQAKKVGDVYGIIRSSAGGKPASDSFINSFERAATVLTQIGDLQRAISGEATGPITGIWRSNNPYDVKAQQIKAQLTAIVPMLARGVYGEVGVLTDNDIKLYSQTLPNMGSVEALRNAILGITLKSVQRSLENKVKVSAGLGRDMSGIEDIYRNIQNESDKILSSINAGQSKLPPQSKVINKTGKQVDMSKFFKKK